MPGERVLVIDDSPTILKVVQLVLTKAGYEVALAADGEEGIERARELLPDLVLLDFVMPKLNGYQVCRAFGESEQLKHVPVVLMSAKGDQVGERFVKVMGIVDYITKTFSPESITAVVEHTLTKYRNKRSSTTEELDVSEMVEMSEETPPTGSLVGGDLVQTLDLLPKGRTTERLRAVRNPDGDATPVGGTETDGSGEPTTHRGMTLPARPPAPHCRHPGAIRDPVARQSLVPDWIPACAGRTTMGDHGVAQVSAPRRGARIAPGRCVR